jgi:hypothetical protein
MYFLESVTGIPCLIQDNITVSDISDDESVTGIPCHPGRVRRRLPPAPDDDDASSKSS